MLFAICFYCVPLRSSFYVEPNNGHFGGGASVSKINWNFMIIIEALIMPLAMQEAMEAFHASFDNILRGCIELFT